MQYNSEECARACVICQSVVTKMTWDNVPLCETHLQERESMQLGSDQLFRQQTAEQSFELAVQEEPVPSASENSEVELRGIVA